MARRHEAPSGADGVERSVVERIEAGRLRNFGTLDTAVGANQHSDRDGALLLAATRERGIDGGRIAGVVGVGDGIGVVAGAAMAAVPAPVARQPPRFAPLFPETAAGRALAASPCDAAWSSFADAAGRASATGRTGATLATSARASSTRRRAASAPPRRCGAARGGARARVARMLRAHGARAAAPGARRRRPRPDTPAPTRYAHARPAMRNTRSSQRLPHERRSTPRTTRSDYAIAALIES